MPLTPGTRLGVYEVTAQLGEGGMGQVWRARDPKLNRDVALKVLPDSFADNADRLARFTREAQVLASLNHPNIAAIYGLEEGPAKASGHGPAKAGHYIGTDVASGFSRTIAIVMELVEGEDLSQRITRGAIPLDEALPIAKQIADALEAAHEQGIVHRDLKPANIKVRPDGTVKVLDFGLAKAMETAEPKGSAPQAATITTPAMTQMGMILGTAAYMAPEQAKGKAVDKRADIWAFGVVLYEMLTGQRLFGAEDLSETLAAVLTRDLALTALPATTPARVRALVRECLVRDPRQRLRDIGEARRVLDAAIAGAPDDRTHDGMRPVPATSSAHGRLPWVAFAMAAVLAAALSFPALRHLLETPPSVPPETRVDIVTPATDQPSDFALSPDGRQIVFVATGEGGSHLWLRSLATVIAQPVANTEGARAPFWAPDGRSIGFFASGALKRLDLDGGVPQTLAPVLSGQGGTWNADGTVVFARSSDGPLLRVPALGGEPIALTTLDRQRSHRLPSFLPDGRHFLFYAQGTPETAGIYLGTLDAPATHRLTAADAAGVYLPAGPGPAEAFGEGGPRSPEASGEGGWLLWVRAGTLVAQRLDIVRAALTGGPVTIADRVAVDTTFSRSAVSVAATGLVAYRSDQAALRQLSWIDRKGAARGTVGDPDASLLDPRVSPDGRLVAVARTVQGNQDLWLLDDARARRFTFDTQTDRMPLWSPDGTRIAFTSGVGVGISQKLASGAGAVELLVAPVQIRVAVASSWSADGRFLLGMAYDPQTNWDIWAVPVVGGDRTPSVVLKTPFAETRGEFSPNGRWLAYVSEESGRREIYVRPFIPPNTEKAPAAGQWQVSTAGGIYPVWRRDGNELYYLNPAGAVMAAPITVTGATFEPGAPVVLFPTRIVGGGEEGQQGRQYDVAPDGRFLINSALDSAAAPITLIQHWRPEGK